MSPSSVRIFAQENAQATFPSDFLPQVLIFVTEFSKATLKKTFSIFSTLRGISPWPIVLSSYFDHKPEENDSTNIFPLEKFRSNDTSQEWETKCGIQCANSMIFSQKSCGKSDRRIFPCEFLYERQGFVKETGYFSDESIATHVFCLNYLISLVVTQNKHRLHSCFIELFRGSTLPEKN
jgi:hypothetical protein